MSAKKKTKALPRHMSLCDRLGGHWNSGKWEAFSALYLRDRTASEATIWSGRLTDALFNALTKVLFIDRAPKAAEDLAALLITEADNSGDRTAADCGRLARYFIWLKSGAIASWPQLSDEAKLPAPYEALRVALKQRLTGGGNNADPEAALLKKMATQIKALPGSKTLTSYSNFLKTAEDMEKASGGEAAFKAIRHIATLLRTVRRKGRMGETFREVEALTHHPDFKDIPRDGHPPAVLRLWKIFCQAGGEKFGQRWSDAVSLLAPLFGNDPKRRKLIETTLKGSNTPPPCRPMLIAKVWPGRSEQERYTQACLCLSNLLLLDDDLDLDIDAGGKAIEYLKTLSEIGAKWRNGGQPWPPQACKCVERLLADDTMGFLKNLLKMNPPLANLTPLTLIYLLFKAPESFGEIEKAAAARPPQAMEDHEAFMELGDKLAGKPPSPEALRIIAALLDEKSFLKLAHFWLETAIEASAIRVANGQAKNLPWDHISGDLLEKILELLPAKNRLAVFALLCRDDGETRRLSGDRARQEEFVDLLHAELDNADDQQEARLSCFCANLFIMLTAWEGASLWLMGRLFSLGHGYMEYIGLWGKAAQAIDHIKDKEAKKELARTAAVLLRQAPKKRLSPGEKEGLAMFEAIALGKKPPRPKFYGGILNELMRNKDFDISEIFNERLPGKRK